LCDLAIETTMSWLVLWPGVELFNCQITDAKQSKRQSSTLCDGGKTLVESEDKSCSTDRWTTSPADDDSVCSISSVENTRHCSSTQTNDQTVISGRF